MIYFFEGWGGGGDAQRHREFPFQLCSAFSNVMSQLHVESMIILSRISVTLRCLKRSIADSAIGIACLRLINLLVIHAYTHV